MKVQWLHLTPTKMGLALHCHGELKLTKWKMEEGGDTKRKMELFPQALADLQALQDVLFELQSVQDRFPLAKTEEKEPTCHISENGRLAEGSHRQALAIKQWANFSSTARRWSGAARRLPAVAPGWRLSGAWRWRPVVPGAIFLSSGASC